MLNTVYHPTTTSDQVIGASVLVVDDDPFSQALLHRQLQQVGITNVSLASNGLAAVKILDSMHVAPDYLVCDVFMPDMDGIEFISELALRNYQGGLILVTGVDQVMLEIAVEIATIKKLKVLGSFIKPVRLLAWCKALGIPLD